MNSVLNTVFELFVIMVIGYIAAKKEKIDEQINKGLSYIVCNIALPALIISSVLGVDYNGGTKQVFIYLLGGILFYLAMPIIAIVLCKLMRFPADSKATFQLMLIFSNCSFMGYPVLESFLGKEAIFVSSIFNLPFNLIIYSYGLYLITKDSKEQNGFKWKNLLSPGSIASVLAIIIYIAHIEVPDVIALCCSSLGGITTPLSMIVLGVSLAKIPLKEAFSDFSVYRMTLCRLIILPLLVFGVATLMSADKLLIGVATGTAAMPVASMCVMLSTLYNGNQKEASIGVFISTLCSMVTIPVLITILF